MSHVGMTDAYNSMHTSSCFTCWRAHTGQQLDTSPWMFCIPVAEWTPAPPAKAQAAHTFTLAMTDVFLSFVYLCCPG